MIPKHVALVVLLWLGVPSPRCEPAPSDPIAELTHLTLAQALELAERHHPLLTEAHARIDAAEAQARQAGRFPDPDAVAGVEQVNAGRQREFVAGIAQPIPLGRRLAKERARADVEREIQRLGLELTHRELSNRIRDAFATALYQERAHTLQVEITQRLEETAQITQAAVEAGELAIEQQAQAELRWIQAQTETRRSQALHESAIIDLAGAIGVPGLEIVSLSGDLETTFEIPALQGILGDLADHPQIREAGANLRAKEADVALARARRIPDVKIEALYHRLDAEHRNTFDIGISIPLPLFSNPHERIRETRAQADAATARLQATQITLRSQARLAHAELTQSLSVHHELQNRWMPRAETLRRTAEARYHAGESSKQEWLAVEREWLDLQLTSLETLRNVLQAWNTLSRYLN